MTNNLPDIHHGKKQKEKHRNLQSQHSTLSTHHNFIKPAFSRNVSRLSNDRFRSRVNYNAIEPTLDAEEFDKTATKSQPAKVEHNSPTHNSHQQRQNALHPSQSQHQNQQKMHGVNASADSFFLPQLVPSYLHQQEKNATNQENEPEYDDENNVWHSPRVKREKSMSRLVLLIFINIFFFCSTRRDLCL